LREDWATSVASLKDRLDGRIHKLSDKKNKSKEEFELEQSLIDQKNCIIDELNKVLVPSENSRLSNCFMSGMELLTPIVFLNTSVLDSSDNLTELDEFLPIIGDNCFLPKEQTEEFLDLPIISDTGREVGAVASWDSSVHESSKLNRVTPEQERLYLIIKAVVRLSDPVPIDLVLRKRICISIYKRQSITSFLRKSVGYAKPGSLRSVGVTFEVVGNVPNIYNETDWRNENAESFFDKYTQAVTCVETVLSLERLKQGDMVTELVTQKEEMNKSFGNKSLKKAASISNIRMTRSTFSLNNLGGSTRNLSGSQTSLNVETLKRHKRQSMSTADPREERRRLEQKQKRLSMPSYKLESFADKIEKVLPFDNGNGSKVGITPMNTKVATIVEENNADDL
jgi:kinesin family protein 13